MFILPQHDCNFCPRLAQFIGDNRKQYPSFFNGPVPSFGELDANFLVVGLAPGLKGANQTGRPFTGDYAGIILYNALLKQGLADGNYSPENLKKDSLKLINTRITNAVRCVPPQNKVEPSEIKNCNSFLKNEVAHMPNLQVILSLGLVSHNAILKAFGHKAAKGKFAHGAVHQLNDKVKMVNSYHTSRYNINTGRLTVEMFDEIIGQVKKIIT